MSVAEFAVPPVVKTITVGVAPARAFDAFAREIGRWWPLATHHLGSAKAAVDCLIEPQVGGRVFERDADGVETVWATVLAYEPPRRLAISWFVGKTPDLAQRVELNFTAEGSGTRVELTHSGWEVLGEAAQGTRDAYDKGWVAVFEQCYGNYANRLS